MFESIVGPKRTERRLGSGAVFSFGLHAGVLALAIWLPARNKGPSEAKGVAVTFFVTPKPGLSPEPAKGGSEPSPAPAPALAPAAARVAVPAPRPKLEPREARKKKQAEEKAEPKQTDTKVEQAAPTPARETPTPPSGTQGGSGTGRGTGEGTGVGDSTVGSGIKGGTGTGTQVGTATGSGEGNRRFEVLAFGPGMNRPQRTSGSNVIYTREAILAQVEGTAIVQCVITLAGSTQGCRIIKGLPHLNEAVLKAVSSWRLTPVMYQGRAVSVKYIWTIKLSPPQ